MTWIIPIFLMLALMGVSAFVMAFIRVMYSRDTYDTPNIANIDPGLQFAEQYNTKTSQAFVPLIFGTVRVTGNIIYENIGGENNDMLYTCVGLGEGSMVASIGQIYVDDFKWEELPTPISDNSEITKFPNGGTGSFNLSSKGLHSFGFMVDAAGKEESTYKIEIYGDATVELRTLVVKGVENFDGAYQLFYRSAEDTNWTSIVTRSERWSRWS